MMTTPQLQCDKEHASSPDVCVEQMLLEAYQVLVACQPILSYPFFG